MTSGHVWFGATKWDLHVRHPSSTLDAIEQYSTACPPRTVALYEYAELCTTWSHTEHS